jgi:decaprenylphospho-beta-D-erythro-pentofuranosid-2-ulose 2-reductase
MRKILIAGATSTIAQHTARLFAAQGDALFLIARNSEKLTAVAADLKTRGAARVETSVADLVDTHLHADLWKQANQALGGIDTVLIAHGLLPDQKDCESSYTKALENFETNFLSVVSLLGVIGNDFEQRKNGTIAVISSVAGDRGRQSNYMYGTAKAAVSTFLQGLRNRLSQSGVAVITLKPGFVDTPMIAHMKRSPLTASPATVAKGIYRAIKNKKDVVYLPGYWRWVMSVIKLIPESIFKRLKL